MMPNYLSYSDTKACKKDEGQICVHLTTVYIKDLGNAFSNRGVLVCLHLEEHKRESMTTFF